MLPFLNVHRGRARKLKLVRKSAPEIAGWRRTTSHVVTKAAGKQRERERERERVYGFERRLLNFERLCSNSDLIMLPK